MDLLKFDLFRRDMVNAWTARDECDLVLRLSCRVPTQTRNWGQSVEMGSALLSATEQSASSTSTYLLALLI